MVTANYKNPKIIEVIDDYSVVMNMGSKEGIEVGQHFLIYRLSEKPLEDPDTKEILENLEYVIGTVRVIHCQDRISTLESDSRERGHRRIVRKKPSPFSDAFSVAFGSAEEEIIEEGDLKPLKNPQVGDLMRPI